MNSDSADNCKAPGDAQRPAPESRAAPAPLPNPDPLASPTPDPWEDTETAHLRAFLNLTYSERFHLLMDAIEFMHKLRPPV